MFRLCKAELTLLCIYLRMFEFLSIQLCKYKRGALIVKNNFTSITTAGLVLLTSNSVFAEDTDDFYVGLQYGVSDISVQGVSDDFSPGIVMGRFGKFHNDNFALEARMGFGVGSDTQTLSGSTDIATFNMGPLIGLYGVGHLDIGAKASIYGLVGVSYAEGSTYITGATSRSATETLKGNGLSIGVGADIGVWKNIGINVEYVSYVNNSEFDINALGIGLIIGY